MTILLIPLTTAACMLIACLAAPLPAHAQTPERFHPADLGQDGRVSLSPGFSPDGNTLYFAQSEGSPIWEYPQRLKISQRSETGWSRPRPVDLCGTGRADEPSVSPDGKTLIFSWSGERADLAGQDVAENFDLFRLDLTDPEACPEPIIGSDINRIRGGAVATLRYVNNESGPILTRNGDLYFWGERLDAVGERDVFVAEADGQGGLRDAHPLGPPINTPEREGGSWVSPDGRIMLVSLNRASTGEDGIYLSEKSPQGWSEPVTLGDGVNNGGAFSPRITPDGKTLVFASTRAFDDTPEGLIQIWSLPVADVPVLAEALSGRPHY